MKYQEIATQAELDALPADTAAVVRSGHFRASGSATVEAYVSASVRAYDSASVRAYDSATVRAYDSATVEASGSATVRASGSATVRASGSATVRAYDSATVRAYDSASVVAGKFVAVHRYGTMPRVRGGVLIQVPNLNECDAATWLDYHGVDHGGASVVLFKAVTAGLTARDGFGYPLGQTVTAPDWDGGKRKCGGGLHFGPTPRHAASNAVTDVTRYLAVRVQVADLVPLGEGKCKAPSCVVLHEVDRDGEAVT